MSRSTLGIIGGGQLGSLLADAAKKLKIKTVILSDDANAPAKNFADQFIYGNYKDDNSINKFINLVDLVTYEFENIPYEILKKIDEHKIVLPKPRINKLIQNRYSEKDFLNQIDIRTTKYKLIKNKDEIKLNENLIPGILKTCTMGYDGKGQIKLNDINSVKNLEIKFNQKYILEKIVDLKKEISIIITRFGKDNFEIYDPIENFHENQILRYSIIPAEINNEIKSLAKNWTVLIAEKLDYIGTLCVEFFIDKKNNLYVNEIAPRVHNSGHWTIEGCSISQFRIHMDAIIGLKIEEPELLYNCHMVNLIGEEIYNWENKQSTDKIFIHLYGKKEVKTGRKMGHLTYIAD